MGTPIAQSDPRHPPTDGRWKPLRPWLRVAIAAVCLAPLAWNLRPYPLTYASGRVGLAAVSRAGRVSVAVYVGPPGASFWRIRPPGPGQTPMLVWNTRNDPVTSCGHEFGIARRSVFSGSLGFYAQRGLHGRVHLLEIPHWPLTLPAAVVLWPLVRRKRRPPGHCPACGYDLRATPDRCPECGREVECPS